MASTFKSSPSQRPQDSSNRTGPRLRRVSHRLVPLRGSTPVKEQAHYRDNEFNITPRHASLRLLTPSEAYQHLLAHQTSRYGPDASQDERANRFERSPCPSPITTPDRKVDENPCDSNMEHVRARIMVDFRAGFIGCHYNYEASEVGTEFEEDSQAVTVPAQISIHTTALEGNNDPESPVDSVFTPLDNSISTHDWAVHPALRKTPNHIEVDTVPDSPAYDDEVECDCCGYDIDDANSQSQVVPLVMASAGDSGYMSAHDSPQYTPNRTTRQFQSPRSPKHRMAISDILCDEDTPPSKRPRSIDDQPAAYHLIAPPSSPVQGFAEFSNDLDHWNFSTGVEEWVLLNRFQTASPEAADIVIACEDSLSFLDETEARRVMLESWDRELESEFVREAEEANAE